MPCQLQQWHLGNVQTVGELFCPAKWTLLIFKPSVLIRSFQLWHIWVALVKEQKFPKRKDFSFFFQCDSSLSAHKLERFLLYTKILKVTFFSCEISRLVSAGRLEQEWAVSLRKKTKTLFTAIYHSGGKPFLQPSAEQVLASHALHVCYPC